MYLVGAPHPHKADAQRLLEKLITDRQRLVTDAEVLQEILHRYVAIDRRDAIQPAFDALLGVVDQAWRLTARWCSARSRLFWGIGSCLPVTQCISPSWNKMESTES
jgi:predicted nucleic acid-binding protein